MRSLRPVSVACLVKSHLGLWVHNEQGDGRRIIGAGRPEEAAFLRFVWKLGKAMGLELCQKEPVKRGACVGVETHKEEAMGVGG